MKSLTQSLLQRRELGLFLFVLLSSMGVGMVDPGFLSWTNWKDILVRSAPTLIVSCGVMLVILTGEIDISTGSMMAVLAALLGIFLSSDHLAWSPVLGIPLVILIGTGIGLVTGILVTFGKVPSIIVTLGWLTAFRGLTTFIMNGENIGNLPEGLSQAAKFGFLGLPVSIWVAGSVLLTTIVLLYYTPIGWRLRATGSSGYSSRMVGLNSDTTRIFAFTFTGFLVGLATIVDVPRLPRIESGIGVGFELLVVTCVVVGGVSITGGKGHIMGVVLAVILMTSIRPMLTFLNIGEEGEKWTRAIQGGFILAAVLLDRISHANNTAAKKGNAP